MAMICAAKSLAKAGIANPLSDPILEVHSRDGSIIASNDDWTTNRKTITATGLTPSDDRESALKITLAKGSYTAVVRGKNGATGVALVEVYRVP